MTCRLLVSIAFALLLAGCSMESPGDRFALKPAWREAVPGTQPVVTRTGETVWVQNGPIVTAADVKSAKATVDAMARPAVLIVLDKGGAARLHRFSPGHLNEPLAIFIDGQLIMAPRINADMESELLVTGTFSKQEVDQMVTSIHESLQSK